MDGVDVESFIRSQRAKLAEEKARFPGMNRPAGGILPTDSVALEKRQLLRQERQSEYLDYIKRREGRKETVSKIRSELSKDRENELARNEVALVSRKNGVRNRVESVENPKSDFAAVRAKAFAQERQYTIGSMGHPDQYNDRVESETAGRKLEEMASQTGLDYVSPHFHGGQPHHTTISDPSSLDKKEQRKAWDDEERDLMQWTRNKAVDGRQKVRQPSLDSPEPRFDPRTKYTYDAKPLPGWGRSYTDEQKEQRVKQKLYAEDLQQQMKERGSMKKRDKAFADHQYRVLGSNEDEHERVRNGDHIQDKGLKSAPPPLKANGGRHDGSLSYNHSYYGAQYPPYPYPLPPSLPPGYQVPPGGPWAPPPFGYPYPLYRPNQDSEGHSQMYYQPYYFSPPRNRHSSHNCAPVPSVLYPYNMPAHDENSRDPHEAHSRREKGSLHDPAAPVRSRYSPPSSFRSGKERSHHLGIGQDMSQAKDKLEYRRELEEQVREKKARELEEKLKRERYEMKKSMEIYDPFGKGGCGAPVRDQHGNLVADLKQMRKINENRLSNNLVKTRPSSSMRLGSKNSNRADAPSDSPEKSTQQTILTYNNRDSESVKQNVQESYRDYLRQQVLEKEKLKQEEKEKQRLEELKQLEQLERDRKKMQEEYQQELEKQRKKEEDLRKKNEAIKLEAEKERHRVLEKRQQEALKEEEERRKIAEKELENKITSPRAALSQRVTWSPPVPTLRHQMKLGTLIPRAETFTETPRLPLPPENSARRSNERKLENVASNDSFIQGNPAFRHGPLRTDSPPVPALRKKLPEKNRQTKESSSEQTTGARNSQTVTRTSKVLSPRQVLPSHSGGEPSVPPKQLPLLGDRREILTKLGALRMYLQEELAKQQTESSSEIFERVKQQRPGLAMPMRPKGSSLSVQSAASKVESRDRDLAAGSISALRYQMNPSNIVRSENPSLTTNGHHRELPKGTSLDTISLVSKKSTTAVRPWGNGVLAHPNRHKESSLHSDRPTAECPPGFPSRQPPGSPSMLSKYSVNSTVLDTMATRTEERMRRLDSILKSEAYGGEVSLDGQSTNTMSLALVGRGMEGPEDERRSTRNGHPPGFQPGIHGLSLPSRNSEQSLECETRHLPIQ